MSGAKASQTKRHPSHREQANTHSRTMHSMKPPGSPLGSPGTSCGSGAALLSASVQEQSCPAA